ncbi:MAG: GSCFA domain-containing protein [Paramuribaculum sp.]|nr:GSCFA domain-containing protein [Paramuribaculum sp.]MDE6489165.1 GSCFA domain-containing protein [Paramuribaculum sp.]
MNFRTQIQPLRKQDEISHDDRIFLIGSCFSDNVGQRLADRLFNVCRNPFGTLYNPASINTLLQRIVSGKSFSTGELVENSGLHHSFLCHSSLSSATPEKTVQRLNSRLEQARDFLSETTVAIITLGTAYVYTLVSDNRIVGNCHRFPASMFNRRRLTTDETAGHIECIHDLFRTLNPRIKIIFTVSPIRHLADGLHENQLSKSTLLLAIDRLCNDRSRNAMYFPAYEALMDDLRDYRFYAADMKHPSDVAADYIFQLFSDSFFSPRTVSLANECKKLTTRAAHIRMTDNETSFSEFKQKTDIMARDLARTNPELSQPIANFLSIEL